MLARSTIERPKAVSNQALNAIGRPLIGAMNMAFLTLTSGVIVALSAPYGIATVAAAWAIGYLVASLVVVHLSARHTGLGLPTFLPLVWRPVLVGAAIYASIAGLRIVLPAGLADWTLLFVLPAIGGGAGLAVMLLIDRRGFIEAIQFIRS